MWNYFLFQSNLIGSGSERHLIQNEIGAAYEASLRSDQLKELERNAAGSELNEVQDRLKKLQRERESQVEPEPSLDEDHVILTVRHPIVGPKTRLFQAHSKMIDVYNWAGSLSLQPEHFQLVAYNEVVYPSDDIYSTALNLKEINSAMLLSQDGEVTFGGFAVLSDSSLQNESSSKDMTTYLDELEHLRRNAQKILQPGLSVTISGENLYNDILNLYKCEEILHETVSISISGESGIGDGVSRDVYSKFFRYFYEKCDGDRQRIPMPTLDSEELIIVGRVITHAFIQYGLFPLELCEVSLSHTLYGTPTEKELLNSFFMFLPSTDVTLIKSFMSGNRSDVQPILDVLTELKVFDRPTKSNIETLCIKAANVALIRLPHFALQSVVEGMGPFWKDVTKCMFSSIYHSLIPTASSVLAALVVNEIQLVDAKVTTWLHRFIRNCSSTELITFIHFITGANSLWPGDIIKVEFMDQPPQHLRPMSQTCFRILQLPRQYASFTQMCVNIKKYLLIDECWAVYDEHVHGLAI